MLPRRLPALWTLLGTWVALLLAAMLVADRRGVRWALRVGPLAVLWLPSVLLLTAALRPVADGRAAARHRRSRSRWARSPTASCGWPRGPLVPAFAGLAAYTLDLAFGSPLIIRSLLGPNPLFGARFYGIGNELEATLAALLLIARRHAARPAADARARAVGAFAGGGVALALVVGAGRLGADVGGVITIGAGAAVAAVLMLPGGLTRRAAALVIAAPIAGLVAARGWWTSRRAVTRTSRARCCAPTTPATCGTSLGRRYELAGRQAIRGFMPAVTMIAMLAIAVGGPPARPAAGAGGGRSGVAARCSAGLVAAGVAGAAVQRFRPGPAAVRDILRGGCGAVPPW